MSETTRRRNSTKQKAKQPVTEKTMHDRLRKVLRELPDNYLECKRYRYHSLVEMYKFNWSDNGREAVCCVSKCSRCGTIREDYMNARGHLVDRRYETPVGYDLPGFGHIQSAPIMREYLARATNVAASREDALALGHHLRLVKDAT